MLYAFLAGRFSFCKSDYTALKGQEAKYAYLYIDGAFGIFAQAFYGSSLALFAGIYQKTPYQVFDSFFNGFTVLSASLHGALNLLDPKDLISTSEFTLALLCVIGLAWNIRFSWYKVPSKLFKLNGYSGVLPKAHKKENSALAGPWSQYRLSVLFFSGISLQLLYWAAAFVCGFIGGLLALIIP